MNTLTQGILYRFRAGGFPEIPHQALAATDQKEEQHHLEDLFQETRALDQSPRDKDQNLGSVLIESSQSDPVECERRNWSGDTRVGKLSTSQESWSPCQSDDDHSRYQEVRFQPEAVDAIDIYESQDGVCAHVWHLDRNQPSLSYQQAW